MSRADVVQGRAAADQGRSAETQDAPPSVTGSQTMTRLAYDRLLESAAVAVMNLQTATKRADDVGVNTRHSMHKVMTMRDRLDDIADRRSVERLDPSVAASLVLYHQVNALRRTRDRLCGIKGHVTATSIERDIEEFKAQVALLLGDVEALCDAPVPDEELPLLALGQGTSATIVMPSEVR